MHGHFESGVLVDVGAKGQRRPGKQVVAKPGPMTAGEIAEARARFPQYDPTFLRNQPLWESMIRLAERKLTGRAKVFEPPREVGEPVRGSVRQVSNDTSPATAKRRAVRDGRAAAAGDADDDRETQQAAEREARSQAECTATLDEAGHRRGDPACQCRFCVG